MSPAVGTLVAGARVAARSGLLAPVGPATVARAVAAVHRSGVGLPALVELSAARWPDQTALVDETGSTTYAELVDRVELLAGALFAAHPAGAGRVALMCRNHRGFVEALLACARIGADVLFLSTDFPGPQLAQVLAGRSFDLAIADGEFVETLAAAGFAAPVVVVDGDGPGSAADLVERGLRVTVRPDRVAGFTLLTSGTTGTPKGAPRVPSPDAFVGVSVSTLERLDLRTNEPMLVAPPLFHGFGLVQLVLGLALGSTVILRRRFDAEAALDDLDRYGATHLAVVPVMLRRLLAASNATGRTPDSLRSVLTGAAPLVPALAAEFMDHFGDVLFNGYGSSEVGIATLATPADLRAAPGTVGRPVRNTTVQILDAAGLPQPVGAVGDIYIASPMVFSGYLGGGDKRRIGGAVSTGDRGFVDAAGRLTLVGREDDMILSGGENVYPQEVEDVLANHPAVADAAVIGVHDEEFGQRLKAFAVLRSGDPVTPEDLVSHVRAQVARYKVPREVVLLDELPRNPAGKVLKSALPQ